ncbi:MAG: hypothetical protein WC686_04150 [Candidatus Shapirobacteria bacterium]|jgi:hypothetical protein
MPGRKGETILGLPEYRVNGYLWPGNVRLFDEGIFSSNWEHLALISTAVRIVCQNSKDRRMRFLLDDFPESFYPFFERELTEAGLCQLMRRLMVSELSTRTLRDRGVDRGERVSTLDQVWNAGKNGLGNAGDEFVVLTPDHSLDRILLERFGAGRLNEIVTVVWDHHADIAKLDRGEADAIFLTELLEMGIGGVALIGVNSMTRRQVMGEWQRGGDRTIKGMHEVYKKFKDRIMIMDGFGVDKLGDFLESTKAHGVFLSVDPDVLNNFTDGRTRTAIKYHPLARVLLAGVECWTGDGRIMALADRLKGLALGSKELDTRTQQLVWEMRERTCGLSDSGVFSPQYMKMIKDDGRLRPWVLTTSRPRLTLTELGTQIGKVRSICRDSGISIGVSPRGGHTRVVGTVGEVIGRDLNGNTANAVISIANRLMGN